MGDAHIPLPIATPARVSNSRYHEPSARDARGCIVALLDDDLHGAGR
jgi:hypothetical protein